MSETELGWVVRECSRVVCVCKSDCELKLPSHPSRPFILDWPVRAPPRQLAVAARPSHFKPHARAARRSLPVSSWSSPRTLGCARFRALLGRPAAYIMDTWAAQSSCAVGTL